MKKMLMAVVVMAVLAGYVHAATFPGSIAREPLVRGDVSERLSIGLGYDWIDREIKSSGFGDDVLRANSISAYMGYNVAPWMTTFVTAGGTSLRGDQWSSRDYGVKLSVGASAYLWEADVLTPNFAAGRISVKGSLEVARHETDTDAGSSNWFELLGALPVGYEFFDRYPVGKSGLQTSLALYVGPVVSFLDGDLAVVPGFKQSFRQEQALGVVAGVDVFFAPSVSVGFKALVFDKVTTGASLRFHF